MEAGTQPLVRRTQRHESAQTLHSPAAAHRLSGGHLIFLGFAVSLAWVVAINILNPFVLQAPPYNWKPDINGLINITGLIGNVIGAFLGGWVVDKYSDWRSKKNNGVFQPETRLHLLIIPALIVPAGCLAFGYGVGEQLNWTAL